MKNDKPKVLHIHFWADIRNSAGSVEKVISALARHGANFLHEIACLSDGVCQSESFEHYGVNVYAFKENKLKNRLLNKMLRLKAFTYDDLPKIINRSRPDVLHFHNRQELVDSLASKLDYRPLIAVHYHRHFAHPVIPESADLLIFPSQRTADDITSKTGTKKSYSVLFNPLSINLLNHESKVSKTSINTAPKILFGGGGSPIKGGKELVSAFLSLPAGSANLILAGRNVEKIPNIPKDNNNIQVIGEIPADDFFKLMLSSDIIAMPSYDEPFGLIAQEAMFLRKLLVVSTTGGLAEFTDSTCAITVFPKDIESLRGGLVKALEMTNGVSEENTTRILSNAQKRIEIFYPENVTKHLESSYADALKKK